MGKKYIIEMEDTMFHKTGESGPETYLWRAKGFNSLVFDRTGISKLTPYTEPNLELIKEKAHTNGYGEGYQDGYSKGMNDYLQNPEVKEESDRAYAHGYSDAESKFSEIRKEAYQKGYETGYEDGYNEPGKNQQEAYQRGLNDAWDAAKKIGNMPYGEEEKAFGSGGWTFVEKHTASEAIEKIRQYEQEKEEFHVGDEVISEDDIKATVIDMDDYLLHVLDENGVVQGWPREDVAKTDRHFPEIAAVLKKMRGENND